MKILRVLVLVLLAIGIGVGIALAATRPAPLPEGTRSAARLEPGPYTVDRSEEVWVDASRTTDANGEYAGASERTFSIALWSPTDAPGPHPLLVYSHGFM